jgi:hypothetical protein
VGVKPIVVLTTPWNLVLFLGESNMVCEGAIENCTFGAVLAKLNLLANKSIYWPLVE